MKATVAVFRTMVTVLFWVAFAVTLLMFVLAARAGMRRQRRVHLTLAPLSLVALAITIVMAERLGKAREFPADVMAIHLPAAKTAGLLAIAVALSGIALWRTERARGLHRFCLVVFAIAVLVATATGVWAFSVSTPR